MKTTTKVTVIVLSLFVLGMSALAMVGPHIAGADSYPPYINTAQQRADYIKERRQWNLMNLCSWANGSGISQPGNSNPTPQNSPGADAAYCDLHNPDAPHPAGQIFRSQVLSNSLIGTYADGTPVGKTYADGAPVLLCPIHKAGQTDMGSPSGWVTVPQGTALCPFATSRPAP